MTKDEFFALLDLIKAIARNECATSALSELDAIQQIEVARKILVTEETP